MDRITKVGTEFHDFLLLIPRNRYIIVPTLSFETVGWGTGYHENQTLLRLTL